MKTAFSWLHLSDLHYGLKGQDCLWPNLRQPFLDDLTELRERCGPWDAVLFTGDLVQSGASAQFEKLHNEVLGPLWDKLRELGSGDAVLLAVPGNHDLFRPNPHVDNPAAERLLEPGGYEKIKEKFWDLPDGSYRRVVTDAFGAWREWWDKAPHRPDTIRNGLLPGDFSATLEKDGRRIGIVGLNTAFLQLGGGDYKERLVWDARQLHGVCDGGIDVWTRDHDACLLLSHHGPDWLTPEARQHGETEMAPAGRFAAHLYGHMHETRLVYIRQGGSRHAVRLLQGGSVFGMDKFGEPPITQRSHGYTAGRIEFDGDTATLHLWPRVATDKTGGWRFIPDHVNAELVSDEGTAPDSIPTRKQAGSPANPVATEIPAAPVGAGSPALPHSTLPIRRPFYGRSKELADIAKFLAPEDRSWGIAIDGPGGMGKTALALEAAHRAPAELYPLKLWVSAKNRELRPEGEQRLHDHKVDDFHALLNELGLALGRDDIPKARPEDRPGLIRHALSGRRALLVLDNLESFTPEERRRIYELLNQLPSGCRALLTSRRRDSASSTGHALRLDKLERNAAGQLLEQLGQHWQPITRLSAAERDQLYEETGGNPLLLTWTAGQLGRVTGRARTLEEALTRLQEAHRQAALDDDNDPLEFIFGDLVETFTAGETAVLAALAHFSQPAKTAWLPPLADLSETATRTALDSLRDRALLLEDDRADTWLLPKLATDYLRRVRPEVVGTCGERLAEQVYALVLENGYNEYVRYPNLEAAWPRIAAALPLLLAGDNRRLQMVCNALYRFLDFSGRWDDRIALSLAAEDRAVLAEDWSSAGWRAYQAGYCHTLRGDAAPVLACAERAAGHWEQASSGAYERATATQLRGHGHRLAEDHAAAIAASREALDLYRGLAPKSRDVASALNSLAAALSDSKQYDEAEPVCRDALALARELPDPDGVATYTGNLADLALDREHWTEAESLAREALKLAEALGRKELIAFDCAHLAQALARQGRSGEGLVHARRAVALYGELRSPDLADAQTTLAECEAAAAGGVGRVSAA